MCFSSHLALLCGLGSSGAQVTPQRGVALRPVLVPSLAVVALA